MDMLQTVLTCTAVAFAGTATGKWTWIRLWQKLRPSIGDCIGYGLSNAYTAAWSSTLALVIFRA
jgi:hypothetical protein